MKYDDAPEPIEPKPHHKPDERGTCGEKRKPYEKPAFRFERVFVTTALSCGKMVGTCMSMNSKVS
jgi:hypothetical protein